MHHDAIRALLLDNRLRHAQLVDPFAQRRQILFDIELLALGQRFRPQRSHQCRLVTVLHFFQQQIRLAVGNHFFALVTRRRIGEGNTHFSALARDAAVLHFFLAQYTAYVAGVTLHGFVERRLGIQLQQEMYAAAQIQTQIHRQRTDRS